MEDANRCKDEYFGFVEKVQHLQKYYDSCLPALYERIKEIEFEHAKLFDNADLNLNAFSVYLCKLPLSGLSDQVLQHALPYQIRKKEELLCARKKLLVLCNSVKIHKIQLKNLLQEHLELISSDDEPTKDELSIIELLEKELTDLENDKRVTSTDTKRALINNIYLNARQSHYQKLYKIYMNKWIQLVRTKPNLVSKPLVVLDSLFVQYAFSKFLDKYGTH